MQTRRYLFASPNALAIYVFWVKDHYWRDVQIDLVHVICFVYVFFSSVIEAASWLLGSYLPFLSVALVLRSLNTFLPYSLGIPWMSASHTYLFFSAQALDEKLEFSNDSDGPARQVPSCDILIAHAARPGHRGDIPSLFPLPITSGLPYPW